MIGHAVTVFIPGYANTVVTSKHILILVLFYKRNRKWTACVYITWRKHSRELGRIWKYLCKRSYMAEVHINFQILPNSLPCLHRDDHSVAISWKFLRFLKACYFNHINPNIFKLGRHQFQCTLSHDMVTFVITLVLNTRPKSLPQF